MGTKGPLEWISLCYNHNNRLSTPWTSLTSTITVTTLQFVRCIMCMCFLAANPKPCTAIMDISGLRISFFVKSQLLSKHVHNMRLYCLNAQKKTVPTYRVSQKKVYNRIFWGWQPDRRRSCCTLLPAPCSSTSSSKRLEATTATLDRELSSESLAVMVDSMHKRATSSSPGERGTHDLRRPGCQPQKILL